MATGGGKGKRKPKKQTEIWKVEKRRQAFTYFKIWKKLSYLEFIGKNCMPLGTFLFLANDGESREPKFDLYVMTIKKLPHNHRTVCR